MAHNPLGKLNKPRKPTKEEIRAYVESLNYEAHCALENGDKLTVIRKDGVFSWKLNGEPCTDVVAQAAIGADPKDAWQFVDAKGNVYPLTRPTPATMAAVEKARVEHAAKQAQDAETQAWNAKVEAKKAAKKQAKMEAFAKSVLSEEEFELMQALDVGLAHPLGGKKASESSLLKQYNTREKAAGN